jgi:hypothetical protein
MRLRDKWRHRATVAMLRSSPVLVAGTGTTSSTVDSYVKQWSPDATRRSDTVLVVDQPFELCGPFDFDESLWFAAKLPPECRSAYALPEPDDRPANGQGDFELTAIFLLNGLARRTRGRRRISPTGTFDAAWDETPATVLHLPGALSSEEAMSVLAVHLPGLHTTPGSSHTLDSDDVGVDIAPEYPWRGFPLLRAQPWFTSTADTTQCRFLPDAGRGPEAGDRASAAARALAVARGGLVLDDDGFPDQL